LLFVKNVFRSLAFWVFVFGLFLPSAFAVKPQRIVLESEEDFEKGNLLSTSLSEEGVLRPAPVAEKIADLPVEEVWWMIRHPGDYFLLGGSPGGKILRVTTEGKSSVVARIPEAYPYAATLDSSGVLYVGGSPKGKVYRMTGTRLEEYFDPKETYIWSLLCGPQGQLYVATGLKGRVYEVRSQGKGSLYCQTDHTHVRALTWSAKGQRLLAGTSDRGVLLELKGPEKAVVLADSGRQEIPRVLRLPDGTVLFLATGAAALPPPPGPSGESREARPEGFFGLPGSGELEQTTSVAAPPGAPPRPFPPSPPQARAVPTSSLWALSPSLYPRLLGELKGTATSLDWFPLERLLLVGVGGEEALLYRWNLRGEGETWIKLGEGIVSATWVDPGGTLWVATSHPARLLRVLAMRRGAGLYESSSLDSGLFARWGSVRVSGRGGVIVQTRTGNTLRPDRSWYPWEPLRDGRIQNPPARYLQFRLRLEEGALVNRVEIAYLPQNVPPQLVELDVLPPGLGYVEMSSPPGPLVPKTIDQLLSEKGRTEPADFLFRVPTRYQPREARGLRTVVWKALDPDGDALRYRVFYRREPDGPWQLLAKDLKEPIFSWDTSGWPDGQYRIRVEASDEGENPSGEGLSDSRESRTFLVDNTPPTIQVLPRMGNKVRFRVSDTSSGIKSVLVSTDGTDFLPALPVGGILDWQREDFEIPCPPGGSLFIRAEDQAGNVASAVGR
jgi:hypothetical protein